MAWRGPKGGSVTAVVVTGLCLLVLASQAGWSAWAVAGPAASPAHVGVQDPGTTAAINLATNATSDTPSNPANPAPGLAGVASTGASSAQAALSTEPASGSWLGQATAASADPATSAPSSSAVGLSSAAPVAFADGATAKAPLTVPADGAKSGIGDLTGLALLLGGAMALAGWRRARR